MRTGKDRDGCSLLALAAARSGSKDVVEEVTETFTLDEVKTSNLPCTDREKDS